MVAKFVALLAVAAATHVGCATACGWKNEACCNIQYNNPNVGVCHDERTVCWEAQCMPCGMNGKKGCDSATPTPESQPLHAFVSCR